ncbi:hypothetical protein THAOC_03628, partial [Thalassiosira oceanica]
RPTSPASSRPPQDRRRGRTCPPRGGRARPPPGPGPAPSPFPVGAPPDHLLHLPGRTVEQDETVVLERARPLVLPRRRTDLPPEQDRPASVESGRRGADAPGTQTRDVRRLPVPFSRPHVVGLGVARLAAREAGHGRDPVPAAERHEGRAAPSRQGRRPEVRPGVEPGVEPVQVGEPAGGAAPPEEVQVMSRRYHGVVAPRARARAVVYPGVLYGVLRAERPVGAVHHLDPVHVVRVGDGAVAAARGGPPSEDVNVPPDGRRGVSQPRRGGRAAVLRDLRRDPPPRPRPPSLPSATQSSCRGRSESETGTRGSCSPPWTSSLVAPSPAAGKTGATAWDERGRGGAVVRVRRRAQPPPRHRRGRPGACHPDRIASSRR